MHKSLHIKSLIGVVVVLFMSVSASAASYGGLGNYGTFLGTFSGNDSEKALFADLGLEADLIEKIDTPATSEDFFSIFNFTLNDDDEIIAGEWAYTGPGIITHIVIKSGPNYSVFEYMDGLNMGLFDTSTLDNKGLSHITAYAAAAPIPLPAAAWLFLSAFVGLIGFGKKRS